MLKDRIVSFCLSRIDVDSFSALLDSNLLFRLPYKYFSQKLINYKFPAHLFLEVTNACNLNCQMCARNTIKRETGYMDFGLFKKIIDQSALFGPRSFCLHIFGEPLLAPRITEMIKYLKDKNKKNTILLTTNGVLLNEDLAGEIIDLGVDRLVVSIIAAKPETYTGLTQADHLARVENNVINLLKMKKAKRKNTPRVYVRMLKNEKTAGEAELFIKKWSRQDVVIDVREAHNYAGKIKNNPFKKGNSNRYPCYHLWFSPGISFDGDVSICCCDWNREAVVGNVNTETLSNIWGNHKLNLYRQYHLRGEYDKTQLCGKCNVWTTYPDIFFKWQKHPRQLILPEG